MSSSPVTVAPSSPCCFFLFLAREAHARPSVPMQEGMGRPVSPQQLPGSDPAGRHQRAAEEQPLPQRLLEGQRTFISCPAQVTSCRSSVHSPASCLSVCQLYLEALPEDKGQWINKTKELRGLYEKIKETVRAPPCGQYNQTNKPPPKEVCSSCLL